MPVLNQRGIAPLGMKPISGHGDPVQAGVLTARKALRYAMEASSRRLVPSPGRRRPPFSSRTLKCAQNFTPMTPAEMQALRDRCRQYAADGRFELYKSFP